MSHKTLISFSNFERTMGSLGAVVAAAVAAAATRCYQPPTFYSVYHNKSSEKQNRDIHAHHTGNRNTDRALFAVARLLSVFLFSHCVHNFVFSRFRITTTQVYRRMVAAASCVSYTATRSVAKQQTHIYSALSTMRLTLVE